MPIKVDGYWWTATLKDGVASVSLKDLSGRTVAEGTGASVLAAQNNATETTQDESARLFLQQVLLPDDPTD